MNIRWYISAVGCLCLTAGVARAELPQIRLDKVFPLGGAAGSDVVLEISGKDLDGAKTLWFDQPGLSATFVKANTFKIHIPPGAPARTYEVRAIGQYGISNSRLFSVTHGLTDVTEIEPNDTPNKAQRVPLNCAINGNSDGNGDDYFRFSAHRGDRVILDCQALRLDSTLRAILVVSQLDGKELVRSRPYYNQTDPLIDFAVPADGDYLVRLYDMTFLGGQPYRLIISTRPQIENIFPPAIQPGQSVQATILGRNLPGGKSAPGQLIRGRLLDQLTVTLTAPTEPAAALRFDQLEPLSSASLNARGFQLRPPGLETALNAATLAFADAPITLEHEPNDTAATAQPVTLPTVICGRFDRPGDGDWYSFTAKAGEQIAVDVLCERIDRPG
ncbi:MAG TPA: hypothetical protein VFA18_05265, partial [Gemmataceae bacterium]|nr:hypothetical protein [Gemmataceae bacterium]